MALAGYAITAFGFLLFFGPLTWASLLEGALDRQNAMVGRAARGTGGVLLCGAWLYVIVNLVLLMSGRNVFCHGLFDSDLCNGHGHCYGAGQCHCDLGYGPESKQSAVALCSSGPEEPCTEEQIRLAVKNPKYDAICKHVCCGGVGSCALGVADRLGMCACLGEYSGSRCEHGPCYNKQCEPHSSCVPMGNTHQCVCDGQWTGGNCQNDPCTGNKLDGSAKDDCSGTHEHCEVNGDNHTCSCDRCWAGTRCELSTTMTLWNQTHLKAPQEPRKPCKVPTPRDFSYPSNYSSQPMDASPMFVAAADRWAEGKDDLSGAGDIVKYHGGVLLPDGRVLMVPFDAKHVGLYDPSNDNWTEGKDDLSDAGNSKYFGGVLLPDGRVLMVPCNANHVGLYDPSNDTFAEGKDDTSTCTDNGFDKYVSGVLLPDGRVLMAPLNAKKVGLYDPSNDNWTEGQNDLSATSGWRYSGGVLLPDGRVLMVPCDVKYVGLYNPSNDNWTEGKDDLSAMGNGKYSGGVLLPDGRVVLVPVKAKKVGLYDAGGTSNGSAYTVSLMSPAWKTVLLPYYNKL